jgi:hypothetical protein
MSGGKNLNKQKNKSFSGSHRLQKIATPVVLCVLVVVFALILLALSFLPASQVKKRVSFNNNVLREAGLVSTENEEQAFVELTYPASGNLGDLMTVQSNLNLGHYALPKEQGHLVAELILNLESSKVSPDGEILYPILGTYPAQASWQVVPLRDGTLHGTLWVHLQIVKANVETQRYLLLSYPLEIQSTTLMGLPIGIGRLICITFAIVGGLTVLVLGIRLWVGVKKT